MEYLLLLVSIVLLLCVIGLGGFLVFLGYELWFHNQKLRVGYLPSYLPHLREKLPQIMAQLVPDTSAYEFIELGCGTGHVLEYFRETYEFNHYTGVELDFVWYLVGKWGHRDHPNTTLIHKNVLDFYPESARPKVIYAYLLPEILRELHRRGCFKNALVITLSFEIPEVEPVLKIPTSKVQQHLLAYDFRT